MPQDPLGHRQSVLWAPEADPSRCSGRQGKTDVSQFAVLFVRGKRDRTGPQGFSGRQEAGASPVAAAGQEAPVPSVRSARRTRPSELSLCAGIHG